MTISFLKSREFFWYWLPPLAWCAVVLVLSGDLGSYRNSRGLLEWLLSWLPPLSQDQFQLVHSYFRKAIGHFGNYAILYFLWFRAYRAQATARSWLACLLALASCLVLALMDEGHQTFFTSRTGSFRDVRIDMSGASASALVTWLFWVPRIRPEVEN